MGFRNSRLIDGVPGGCKRTGVLYGSWYRVSLLGTCSSEISAFVAMGNAYGVIGWYAAMVLLGLLTGVIQNSHEQ